MEGEDDSVDIEETKQMMNEFEEFDKKLKRIDEVDDDDDLEAMKKEAMDHFSNLMSLGESVEPRFSAGIFDAASKLFGHALTAKTTKIDRKLRAKDIEIKMRRLEMQERQADKNTIDGDEVQGTFDRNDILTIIRQSQDDDK